MEQPYHLAQHRCANNIFAVIVWLNAFVFSILIEYFTSYIIYLYVHILTGGNAEKTNAEKEPIIVCEEPLTNLARPGKILL